ncbi:MAG: LysM peptidoglycan-binding domain-containing protein [Actinomycetota bacterium]
MVLFLVFILGRATGGGADSEQVDDLQARLASAQAEIEQLERQVRAAQAAPTPPVSTGANGTGAQSPAAGSGTESGTGTPSTATTTTVPAAAASGEDQIHTVTSGDTLRTISQKFYGQANLDGCIAQAQSPVVTDPTKLQLGDKLTIPMPKPTAPCT